MKLNVSNPSTGQQKVFEVEDEQKVMHLYEKRMGMEIEGGPLGEQFEGCVFRISGGNDKQGFPMMQGILKNQRVRLLFSDGMKCYRIRRKGMRKRKSVRGCYVGYDIAILNLILVKYDKDIEGLTDGQGTHRLGPKRAGKIRSMFNLDQKKDKVNEYVVRREIQNADGAVKNKKAPKVQRIITKQRLQRKRFRKNSMIKKVQKSRAEQKVFHERMHEYKVQQKELRHANIAKKKKAKKVIKA